MRLLEEDGIQVPDYERIIFNGKFRRPFTLEATYEIVHKSIVGLEEIFGSPAKDMTLETTIRSPKKGKVNGKSVLRDLTLVGLEGLSVFLEKYGKDHALYKISLSCTTIHDSLDFLLETPSQLVKRRIFSSKRALDVHSNELYVRITPKRLYSKAEYKGYNALCKEVDSW